MKLCIVVGTRPEIIKMSPLIRECQNRSLDFTVLHTGQHYSFEMDKVFFHDLKLPHPDINLDIGSASHCQQLSLLLSKLEPAFIKMKPDIVLVEGDTNTVLAAALAANKLCIPVAHVEAGLRSYFREMPEELNRILADHCSDFLFAPTEKSMSILVAEGLSDRAFLSGNTIVDAVQGNLELAKHKSDVLSKLAVAPKSYVLVTAHRQENVDNKSRLSDIMSALSMLPDALNLDVVYPVHPRTRKMLDMFSIQVHDSIKIIDPVGYLEFLFLQSNAALVLTDSGGIQEESCILGVPCVTLRDNTERPETIDVGANVLAGTIPSRIIGCSKKMLSASNWSNPFGDGTAAVKIIDILDKRL